MQIVIDIPEEVYNSIKSNEEIITYITKDGGGSVGLQGSLAIINGTPLPEHHGRLKDIDAFITKVTADRNHSAYLRSWTTDDVLNALDNSYAPTIIEADKESESE